MLSKLQRGRSAKPPRILCYGIEGVGKSTFASQAPKPVFIQCEDGLDELDVDKFPLATKYDDVLSALAELRQESHEYETVVNRWSSEASVMCQGGQPMDSRSHSHS
jgi:hypothetical protein